MPRKRTKYLKVKIGEEEYEDWRARSAASGLSLADYIRCLIHAQPVNRTPQVARRQRKYADPRLIRQLASIGNNINQIARWANTYKPAASAVTVINELVNINDSINALLEMANGLPEAGPSNVQSGE